jgi:PAS domain S-box-containing protein
MENGSRLTLLNVDDNAAGRYAVTRILQQASFLVKEAATGREALQLALEQPALIILDVNLPDMSGFEVCRRIKADPRTASIPVLHLSATYARSEDRTQGLEGGADGYLVQPVEPPELIANVRALLRVRKAEAAARASENRLRAMIEAEPEGVMLLAPGGKVLEMNSAGLAMFEIDAMAEILGQSLEPLVAPMYHDAFRALMQRVCEGHKDTLEFEIIGLRGTHRWVETHAVPFRGDADAAPVLLGITRDNTRRKASEQVIRAALREKDVLLKEVHHRVKNNLQVVSSLLSLQASHIQDRQVREMLRETQSRVKSMSYIHEKLYRSRDLAQVDFAEYIRDLAHDLFSTYRVDTERITLLVNVQNAWLSIETALPCGLILNELISNCLRHAFPADRAGEVRIDLRSNPDGTFVLTVADTGIGFPKALDIRATDSLGLQLVMTLVEQVKGTIEVQRDQGTTIRLIFAEPNHPAKDNTHGICTDSGR